MPDWLDPRLLETLQLGLLGRLLLATALGGAVGLERELSGKPAGLRTNILICVGATLLMEVSRGVAAAATANMPADPGRIAAQVVSGIGFIGAGTILVARGHVIGLTTAATLWVVAAIGLAVGSHAYVEAIGTTLLVVVVLVMLGRLEEFFLRRRRQVTVEVVTDPSSGLLDAVDDLLRGREVEARATEIQKGPDEFRLSYEVRGSRSGRDAALRQLAASPGVRKVKVL